MEEPVGAQYAVHIALHTLKERCKSLQQRVGSLEEENLSLRVQCSKNDQTGAPLSEVDKLKRQITELSENKQQLLNKVRMVTNENQELWSRLSTLTHANQNLGTQLNKINDSLNQYTAKNREHTPLIRSKTFTQETPQNKVLQKNIEENNKLCAELEEISLKIINSFAQEKSELESLYSEITEVQYNDNIITDSCGFYYDDCDNNIMDNFNSVLNELKVSKEIVYNQKVALKLALNKITSLQEVKKMICDRKKTVEMMDKATVTISTNEATASSTEPTPTAFPTATSENNPCCEIDMICPVCCKTFFNIPFQDFQMHVEKHFIEDENFEIL